MERNLERNGADPTVLSQSYIGGIQRIAGNYDTISHTYQMPTYILAKRKESWNSLFKKYSSMVSEVEINIDTLQPEESNETENVEQSMPMRKPMSMVQYWVDTGHQPYMKRKNDIQSDSGSSLAEDEDMLAYVHNLVDPIIESSSKNNVQVNRLSAEYHLQISSNSSIDTAAYILANNNTTKKIDSLVKDLKSPKKMEINEYSKYVSIKEDAKVRKPKRPKIFSQLNDCKHKTQKAIRSTSMNSDQPDINNKTTCINHNGFTSLFFSDTDESFTNNKSIGNVKLTNIIDNKSISHTLCNGQKEQALKRKKLYKSSESPAEFTPASEDRSIHKISSVLLRKSRSLNICEHPALETPKIRTKTSYLLKQRKLKSRKKRRNLLLSLKSLRDEMVTKSFLSENSTLNISDKSKEYTFGKIQSLYENTENLSYAKNCESSFELFIDSTDSVKNPEIITHSLQRRKKKKSKLILLNNKNNLLKNELKQPSVKLYKLPYRYDNQRLKESKQVITKRNQLEFETKYVFDKIDKTSKQFLDIVSTDNIDLYKDKNTSTSLNKKKNADNAEQVICETFTRTNVNKLDLSSLTFRYVHNDSEKNVVSKSFVKKFSECNFEFPSPHTTEKWKKESKPKYTVINSSSDEDELTIEQMRMDKKNAKTNKNIKIQRSKNVTLLHDTKKLFLHHDIEIMSNVQNTNTSSLKQHLNITKNRRNHENISGSKTNLIRETTKGKQCTSTYTLIQKRDKISGSSLVKNNLLINPQEKKNDDDLQISRDNNSLQINEELSLKPKTQFNIKKIKSITLVSQNNAERDLNLPENKSCNFINQVKNFKILDCPKQYTLQRSCGTPNVDFNNKSHSYQSNNLFSGQFFEKSESISPSRNNKNIKITENKKISPLNIKLESIEKESQKKSLTVNISSDEECIIPLRLHSNKSKVS